MLSRLLDRNARWLATGWGLFWLLLVYLGLHLAIRVLLFTGGSQDDSETLLFTQTLALGYKPTQPPLYNWLAWGATRIFGPTLTAVAILRFALHGLTYFFLYRAARRIFAEPRAAVLAALSPVALYYMAWDATLNYSHTLLLATLSAAFFHALLRLRERDGSLDYLWFGLVLGAGMLSKFGFVVFAAALLLAALGDRTLRGRLAARRALTAAVAAALPVAPFAVWFLANGAAPGAALGTNLYVADGGDYWGAVGRGLYSVADGLVSFLVPFAIFFALAYPRAFLPVLRSGDDGRVAPAARALLARHHGLLLAVALVAVLAFGVTQIKNHYFFLAILLPLHLVARGEAAGPSERGRRWYAAALTGMAALGVAAMIGKYLLDPRIEKKPYFHLPYGEIAEGLREAGFAGGTIALYFHRIDYSGNLRPHFPAARIVTTKYPYYVPPPPPREGGQCLLLWDAEVDPDVPLALVQLVEAAFGATPLDTGTFGTVAAPIPFSDDREMRLAYALYPQGLGDCR